MSRAVRWYLFGSLVLIVLAGCTRTFFAEREPWRREAEAACLKSGAVKESPNVVRIKSIEGPGICGADFPLKVAALGGSSAIGFGPELRPPGAIPGAPARQEPRWPIAEPRYSPAPAPLPAQPLRPVEPAPLPPPAARTAPVTRYTWGDADLRPSPLPPMAAPPRMSEPQSIGIAAPASAPLSLRAPSVDPDAAAEAPYDFRKPYADKPYANSSVNSRPAYPASSARPLSPPMARLSPPSEPAVVPLGPSRAPPVTGSVAAAINPPATLACPLVSALDTWIASTVQPAAMRWFRQPVVEIRQISAYSCRGMNGQPGAHISEHAFGNALDIAAFTLADGRKVTVKSGWRGSAEEQGFLRDVQGGACDQFRTVLAPGSNRFHYDHIHVDLMRRRGGRVACNPRAIPGEVVAAQVRAQQQGQFARRSPEPSVTGSIAARRAAPAPRLSASSIYRAGEVYDGLPQAVPGEDFEIELEDDDSN